ncbi:MAG TPA: 6-carboxytetrahydropterin synthase [Vicinamibacteria bacterium]|jgi:6-pyruvoyltetrahydropterin/6-carboxytetrahydropterin synthase
MQLGVVEHVDCAHFLPGHPKCGQIHGHTYRVEVMVEGDPGAGMLMDFGEIKARTREVLQEYDHRNWNDVLPLPTVENICQLLHSRLRERFPFPVRIRVWEGHGKWAEL